MPVDTSADISPEYLRSKIHVDLLESTDEHGEAYVEEFLTSALEVAKSYLADHRIRVNPVPEVIFDETISGVNYDPYHRQGEMLLFGGPRGILQGGYQYLSHRDYLDSPSLLTILSKGLIHAHNQHLARAHFDAHGQPVQVEGSPPLELYDVHKMLAPSVDEGLAQMFCLYVEGDITDKSLREGFIDEWASWYETREDLREEFFEVVAYTVSDRIEQVNGDEQSRIAHGLAIQEPLIKNGQVSVLTDRLGMAQQ